MNPVAQFFVFFFGAIFGRFVNAVVCRLRTGEGFVFGRSHCVVCRHELAAIDLVPVFSWLALGGRCRYCRKPISPQYLLVEVSLGLLFLLATLNLPQSASIANWLPVLLLRWYCFSVLVIVFLYDLRYLMILRSVIWPAAAVVFVANVALGVSWPNLLLAATLAGGFFWLQFVLSRGRWIGGGDAHLGVLMGVMLGWPNIMIALFMAYVLGAFCGIALILLRRKTMQSQVPFGTFLTVATAIVLLFGDRMLSWYLSLSL